MGEQRGAHRLVELGGGVGVGAHPPLLAHHLALGGDDLVGEGQAGHAVGLELHHRGEVLAGHPLEIGGVVIGSEGVFLAAEFGDDMGELALLVLFRALEHQMFEEMGDAALAVRIIGRAVAIPHHVGHDRRAMVGNDHHVHAIRQLEMIDTRPRVAFAPLSGFGRRRFIEPGDMRRGSG